jgi:hypothetical protein
MPSWLSEWLDGLPSSSHSSTGLLRAVTTKSRLSKYPLANRMLFYMADVPKRRCFRALRRPVLALKMERESLRGYRSSCWGNDVNQLVDRTNQSWDQPI